MTEILIQGRENQQGALLRGGRQPPERPQNIKLRLRGRDSVFGRWARRAFPNH